MVQDNLILKFVLIVNVFCVLTVYTVHSYGDFITQLPILVTDRAATNIILQETPEKIYSVQTQLGFGFPTGSTGYFRFDLIGEAKFIVDPKFVHSDSETVLNKISGGSNNKFVIFSIINNTNNLSHNSTITMSFDDGNAIEIIGTDNSIGVVYTLHDSDTSAMQGKNGPGILHNKSGEYIKFKSPIKASIFNIEKNALTFARNAD